jgi:putative ABC transport system permease protein
LPEIPFGYSFMEERVTRLYKNEQQQSNLFTIFSCISILIACLGLFGLSAFTISQRVKEIGVRKVLGAGITEIVRVLSIDFLKLVIIAVLIGLPISWYAMSRWLRDFAYRIDIPWWALLLASLTAIFIAFATVSIQALKAAFSNPVKSLRTE